VQKNGSDIKKFDTETEQQLKASLDFDDPQARRPFQVRPREDRTHHHLAADDAFSRFVWFVGVVSHTDQ
jgi:hypothetical protein